MSRVIGLAFLAEAVCCIDRETEELFQAHNELESSDYELSLDGPFADMSWGEFKSKILMDPQDCSATMGRMSVTDVEEPLPAHVDWRDQGVVSGVKNQGHCGSCWTFSTTGALEAHHAIKYKNWRTSELSEQQLLDCGNDFDNHACSGGLPSHAFEYIQYAGGLSKEFFYPYRAEGTGDNSKCQFDASADKAKIGAGTIRSFNVTEGDEKSLERIVATVGPVSVAFQVVDDFRLYKRGIYSTDKCQAGPKDVNHAVLIVGYGTEPDVGRPYWIVKNSWGNEWGEDGYFKIARGRNMCGIATCASYPILDTTTSDSFDETATIDVQTV